MGENLHLLLLDPHSRRLTFTTKKWLRSMEMSIESILENAHILHYTRFIGRVYAITSNNLLNPSLMIALVFGFFAFFIASHAIQQERWQSDAYIQTVLLNCLWSRKYSEPSTKLIRWPNPSNFFWKRDSWRLPACKKILRRTRSTSCSISPGLPIDSPTIQKKQYFCYFHWLWQ